MPPKEVNHKRSIAAYETKCNGFINGAETFAGANFAGLTIVGLERAKLHVQDLTDQCSRMETRWEDEFKGQLEAENTPLHDELEARVTSAGQKVRKAIDILYELMEKPTMASSASVASTPKAKPKMDNSFKPPVLAASTTLEEFYTWEAHFLGHFKLNEAFLKETNQETRRLFLTCLLDSKIQAALSTDILVTLDTPIRADNEEESILKWLKDHLLRHSPLFIRRFEYSNCRQRPKETFGDWWTRKKMKAKECDLAKVDADSIQITELICGIQNQELRKDILRRKDPTLVELVALGNRYDTSARIQKVNLGRKSP